MATSSRFPSPWTVIEQDESMKIVDANGQPIAYVYYEDNEQRRRLTNRMTKKDAAGIAAATSALPLAREAIKAALAALPPGAPNDNQP